jgi:hypothetical protein
VTLRVIRCSILFLVLTFASAASANVTITRVFPGWRDAASFKRVSEYFTGRENPGNQIVLRTDATQRAGYYFLIRTHQDTATSAKVRLTYFIPGEAEPKVVTFPVELPGRTSAINLGLTGASWADPKASAVAWKVDLLGPDESVLATEKSYLWDQPAR